MMHSNDTDFDKEISLVTDNVPVNWQSIFDSTLYGALKPVLSFNKTEKTRPYLSSIKEIYVTFLQNSTHFHFSIFSACCPFSLPSFLPFILFIFTVFLYSFSVAFRASIVSIGNKENKQNASSLSVYITLRHKCNDKIQLLAIRFENFHSPILNIYHTHTHTFPLRHIH